MRILKMSGDLFISYGNGGVGISSVITVFEERSNGVIIFLRCH